MDGIILSFASCVSVYIVLVWKRQKGIIVSMDEQYKEILDAAVSLFDQKGLAFTVDDICNALHISKKTIYRYFKTKEDLLCALLDEGFTKIFEEKRRIIESDLSIMDKIKQVMIAMPEQYLSLDFRQLSRLQSQFPKAYEKLTYYLDSEWDPIIQLIEEGIEDGAIRKISIPIFRATFTAAIHSFLSTDVLKENKIAYREAMQELIYTLVEGIKGGYHV